MVHTAPGSLCRLRSLRLLFAAFHLAGRAAVRLFSRAEGTCLSGRVHKAALGIALGQDTAGRPHVAIVLYGIALVLLTNAHLAAIHSLVRQGIPVEVRAVVAGRPLLVNICRMLIDLRLQQSCLVGRTLPTLARVRMSNGKKSAETDDLHSRNFSL